ncbi:MAG: glucosaminidase domain-containing protein [Bacteroidetes bacterium]|nr:glucosaminidase domain-containing protein [Bacteroidota bacterium]
MREYHIPASITLSQGILESGSGSSVLAREANNHFGIKCHRGWEGKTFYADDDEKNECFRAYDNPEQSFHDHSLFLTTRPRYAPLFELDVMDYKGWAYGLSKAGYATNPRYPELLIRIIERHQLYRFDSLAMRSIEATPPLVVHKDDHRFLPVSPSQYEVVGKSKLGRFIFENNRRKLVFAREGDKVASLASEFNIYSYQIRKYNELSKNEEPEPGQMIYLQKKSRRSHKHRTHVLREGESLHGVSQQYGIRLHRLLKMNDLHEGSEVKPGTVLRLR